MVTGYSEKNLLKLWRAVLAQAKKDLSWKPIDMANSSLYNEKVNARNSVKWWIGTEDFFRVCNLAKRPADLELKQFRGILNGQ